MTYYLNPTRFKYLVVYVTNILHEKETFIRQYPSAIPCFKYFGSRAVILINFHSV